MQLKRADIARSLSSAKGSAVVSVRLIEYSSFAADKRSVEMPPQDAAAWIASGGVLQNRRQHVRRWIDIWGYSTKVMERIADDLHIHEGADVPLAPRSRVWLWGSHC